MRRARFGRSTGFFASLRMTLGLRPSVGDSIGVHRCPSVVKLPLPMPTSVAEKKKRPARGSRPAPELIFGNLWEFDPAPETADPKLKARYDLFIDGKFV